MREHKIKQADNQATKQQLQHDLIEFEKSKLNELIADYQNE